MSKKQRPSVPSVNVSDDTPSWRAINEVIRASVAEFIGS